MFTVARYFSLALGLVIIGLMSVEISRRPSAEDAAPFHTAASKAIEAIPRKFGTWEGVDVPVPVSAQALLKPNAMLSRRYSDSTSGEQVGVVLVQCRDTRDMAGHYPPICYPGQGWVQEDAGQIVPLNVGGRAIRAVRYEFHRQSFDQVRTLVVYNFFAVPGQESLTDMAAIRYAASDYTARPFGAAQIQVALNRPRPLAEEVGCVEGVLAPFGPVLDVLSDPKWRR